MQASIHVSGVARYSNYQTLDVFGSDGMLRVAIDRRDADWMVGRLWGARGADAAPQLLPIPQKLTQGLEHLDPKQAPGEFLFAHLTRRFAQWIRAGEPAVPSFRDGLEAQKVLDALLKSVAEERWVGVG